MKNARLLLPVALAALSACTTMADAPNYPETGWESVNQPVVGQVAMSMDLPTGYGGIGQAGRDQLEGWFRTLGLAYGDRVSIDGPGAAAVRAEVADLAGTYGLSLDNAAPVTPGAIAPGMARVIVTRTRASVPNCPNWSVPSQPSWQNRMSPNFGCAVNGNLAAIVADPADLMRGRDAGGVADPESAAKAVNSYRKR